MIDVFISHAGEDKDRFVRPLAERLAGMGLRVWYDEFILKPGDSLRRSIDSGLNQSRFGIVVLSPDFFRKEWPQKELDALVALEVKNTNRIIPIWHRVGHSDVVEFSPLLADRLAINSKIGITSVAWAVYSKVTAVSAEETTRSFDVLGPAIHQALLSTPMTQEATSQESDVIKKGSIRDRKTYVREVLHLLQEPGEISIMCMDGVLPYIFYGGTDSSFTQIRALECQHRTTMMGLSPEVYAYWQGFWKAYREGKQFRYAVNPTSMNLLRDILRTDMSHESATEVLCRIETDIRLCAVDVRVTGISSPFCMFITESTVLFAMISPRVTGLVVCDEDLVALYQQMFDLYHGQAQPVHNWIAGEQNALSKQVQ